MNVVTFVKEDGHSLTAHLDVDGCLVFEDEELDRSGHGQTDRLLIQPRHKHGLFLLLNKAVKEISMTCGETEETRLFWALEHMARSGVWRSLGGIERWMMNQGMPFVKQVTAL